MTEYKQGQTSAKTSSKPKAEWKTLDTRVAGHKFAHGDCEKQKPGVIDLDNGLILKALQTPPRGTRELEFYQTVFDPNCTDSVLVELRQFLPPFYGSEEIDGEKYLKLGNLTAGFKYPCVMDLKMGKITYDQDATPEKIAHEIEKYPPLKYLGFQISGMLIHYPETQLKENFSQSHCRRLTEENITTEGLGYFFGLCRNDLRKNVISIILARLRKLESWFLKQKKFTFIASSLLMVYEGSKVTETNHKQENIRESISTESSINKGASKSFASNTSQNNLNDRSTSFKDSEVKSLQMQKRASSNGEESDENLTKKMKTADVLSGDSHSVLDSHRKDMEKNLSPKICDVHLIDFAHAFPATDIDNNFLFGLQKLISCLNTLLE